MMEHEMARNLLTQEPGRGNRFAEAAGTLNIAQGHKPRHKRAALYSVIPTEGDAFTIAVLGRVKWALDCLRGAGLRGCTPILNPAPRWSAYVLSLREMGVEIETVREPHEGDYPGSHGRYVLRAVVTPTEGGAT